MARKRGIGLVVFGIIAVVYSILWFVAWLTEAPLDQMHVSAKLWDLYFAAPLLFIAGLLMVFRTRFGAWLGTAAYAILFYGSNMDFVGAYFHGEAGPERWIPAVVTFVLALAALFYLAMWLVKRK
ncbi:MAG: hypothetical protein JSW52_01615 [Candidatus Coatesbacteria bacterium]|nr:MAG: hypothetical protein JSW52_01615 [Candidatus Coatesbacteria bacterium]